MTYFRRFGFSINEGRFPTVLVWWAGPVVGFYLALAPGLRCWKFWRGIGRAA